MIAFLKDTYLTAFALGYRLSRSKDQAYKVVGGITPPTVFEFLILLGASDYLQMYLGKKVVLSKLAVYVVSFALYFVNMYVLYLRGHGVKFERDFDSVERSRRRTLVASCAVIVVTGIAFFIYSAVAFRHFIGAK